MNKLAHAVLFHKKTVLTVFIIVAAACLLMMQLVKINYSMSDYLPADAPSTAALKVMEDNFPGGIPNAGVYVPDLTVPAALNLKDKIASVTGVTSVMWLDDIIDIRKPLETADTQTVQAWYKDGAALFSVTIESTRAAEAIAEIRELIGSSGAISGTAANTAAVDDTMGDVSKIMLFVIPLVLLVLLLTTSSWLEPLLFLVTIGVAILLNEGTNLFFGEISFVTRATSAKIGRAHV